MLKLWNVMHRQRARRMDSSRMGCEMNSEISSEMSIK